MIYQNAPMSVSMAPTDEFLATTHVESRAICLWSNRTQFEDGVTGTKVIKKPVHMALPDVAAELNGDIAVAASRGDDGEISDEEEDGEDFDVDKLPPPTGHIGTLKFSGKNQNKWKALVNYEKMMQKARLPDSSDAKDEKVAPFFLA